MTLKLTDGRPEGTLLLLVFFPNLPVLADFVLATAVVAYDAATRLAELQVS